MSKEMFAVICPFCGEVMKVNMTYEIDDISPDLKSQYCEVISLLCFEDMYEMLLYMPWSDDEQPMMELREIQDAIRDMEVL